MKGTILDFLNLANQNQELAKELVELAARHDFTFNDELSDEDLEKVAGGAGTTIYFSPGPPLRVPSQLYAPIGGLGDTSPVPTTTAEDESKGIIPSSDMPAN